MKAKILLFGCILLLAACSINTGTFGPYKLNLPKGFRSLSKTESDSLVKTFAGNFKNAGFYHFYLKESMVLGIYSDQNGSPDFDARKQVVSSDQFRRSHKESLKGSEEKYDGYHVEKWNAFEVIISDYHSSINRTFYKAFITQNGNEVLKGLIIFSQADSLKGQHVLNSLRKSIKLKQ